MSHADKPAVNPLAALFVAFVILSTAIAVLVTAYGYHGGSGLFPRFIGWIFVGLAGVELLFQVKSVVAGGKRSAVTDADKAASRANFIKEVKGVIWIGAFLVGLYFVGFLITIPVYLFSFMRFSGHRSIQQSMALAIGSTAFIYLLFTELLDYKLYAGSLFGA